MVCPECVAPISAQEQKYYLSSEEIKEIEQRQLDKFMANSKNLVKCPCGAMMEATAGQVDYN